jgi:transcriptional coactivator HFI1/ADA1
MAASPKSKGHEYGSSRPTSSLIASTNSRMPPSEHDNLSLRHHNGGHHHHSVSSTKLRRVDTNDLKSKLATALGNNGKRYWSALLAFMTAKIDREEFEEETSLCLKSQHGRSFYSGTIARDEDFDGLPRIYHAAVHLHNQLVLGLLYNASAGIAGPSSLRNGHSHHKRDANGDLVGPNGDLIGSQDEDDEDEDEPMNRVLAPPGKRLRMLTAGLSRKDRARIKNIPKNMTHSKGLASGAASSLGWAGAGADMLEKKRKEEEKRRSLEEKKRVKEVHTQIGAKDWKDQNLRGSEQIASVHAKLSSSECNRKGKVGRQRCCCCCCRHCCQRNRLGFRLTHLDYDWDSI